jgi:hypothetical protein
MRKLILLNNESSIFTRLTRILLTYFDTEIITKEFLFSRAIPLNIFFIPRVLQRKLVIAGRMSFYNVEKSLTGRSKF